MDVISQVEVVMQCNIRARTRIDRLALAPCATSTPIKKPLMTLNNVEGADFRKRNDLLPKAASRAFAIDGTDAKRLVANVNKDVLKRKRNKTSPRRLVGDDDSEYERERNQSKGLIIKLGSSSNNRWGIRKKCFLTETSMNANKQGNENSMNGCLKPTKTGDSVMEERYGSKSAVTPKQVQDLDPENNTNIKKNLKLDTYNNKISTSIESGCNENSMIKSLDIQNGDINQTNGIIRKKRKYNTMQSAYVKRSKTKPNLFISSPMSSNRKEARMMRNKVKLCGRRNVIKQESLARLSMSHEIFSDSKEREFRDSLDMMADDEEVKIIDINENEFAGKQKNLSKKKIKSVSPNEIQTSANSQLLRLKREKKSPKEFWLPESARKIEASQIIKSRKKVKDDHQIVSSVVKCNEPEDVGLQVSDSCNSKGDDAAATVHVKTISEMEFQEIGTEDGKEQYSVALGWQFSRFKCCALKIGANHEASGRTKSEKSHFGGVILNGRISMKIGEIEIKMKKGQMFHVPPLTDWRAINIGRTDCILHYWAVKL